MNTPENTTPRFEVPVDNFLIVWDSVAEKVIHLGSRTEATELCELLNHLSTEANLSLYAQSIVQKQTKTILRLTAKLDDLSIAKGDPNG